MISEEESAFESSPSAAHTMKKSFNLFFENMKSGSHDIEKVEERKSSFER